MQNTTLTTILQTCSKDDPFMPVLFALFIWFISYYVILLTLSSSLPFVSTLTFTLLRSLRLALNLIRCLYSEVNYVTTEKDTQVVPQEFVDKYDDL